MIRKIILKALPLLLLGGAVAVSCDSGVEEWNPSGGGGTKPTPVTPSDPEGTPYSDAAVELFTAIKSCYGVKSGATKGLYYENYPQSAGDNSASFLWPYDGIVSGIAGLNKLGYSVNYTDAVEKFQCYWRTSGTVNVGGYGSSTNGTSGGGDRFYDDNSIVGLNLVEAYRQTGNNTYLERAAKIVSFLNSGKDNTLGTALWWNESYKNVPGVDDSNKPACANGYATWFLMSYYEVCPQTEKANVLKFAKELYTWIKTNLKDDDGCYWNSIGADKTVNKTKWTYNTGAMIAAGVRLYKATADETYLNDAKASADGSFGYFVKARNGINRAYPTNDPWFTIKLIKSYIELEPYYNNCTNYISTFISFTDYALQHGKMQNGLFYEDWTGVKVNPDRDKSLLMQDAALESLTTIALYKGEKPNED